MDKKGPYYFETHIYWGLKICLQPPIFPDPRFWQWENSCPIDGLFGLLICDSFLEEKWFKIFSNSKFRLRFPQNKKFKNQKYSKTLCGLLWNNPSVSITVSISLMTRAASFKVTDFIDFRKWRFWNVWSRHLDRQIISHPSLITDFDGQI